MKTVKIHQSSLIIVTALAFIFGGLAQAQPEGLGEDAGAIFNYIEAGEEEELQEFLAELSEEERIAAVRELAVELTGGQAARIFPVLFKTLTFIQPDQAMVAFAAAVEAGEGRRSVVKGAVQGLITGSLEHPDVTTEDERMSAMISTAEAAAATAIGIAEDTEQIDLAEVAYALMSGGMVAVEPTEEAAPRARALGEAMSNAGVGAASEENQPGVARAMMLALSETREVESRRAGVAGVVAGGEAAGGEPAARAMGPLGRRLAQVAPVGPMPLAPLLDEQPDVDPAEASPF